MDSFSSQNSEVISLLQKKPIQRSQIDINKIFDHFKDMLFFNRYLVKSNKQEHFCYRICKQLQVMKIKKGEMVFHKQDKCNGFYLVMCGKVCVLAPRDEQLIRYDMDQLQ